MWKCHKCGKPVFFAERKQSLGYDWHPECLRCEECGKRLNPGQHAEHKGIPYCHVPCYGALFGPQLFGHGTRVESHKSFGVKGTVRSASGPSLPRDHFESKLKLYNQFFDNKSHEIRSREVNGRLVLEGALRVYWGVQGVIHLKEDDDQRTVVTVRKRNSCRYANSVEIDSDKISQNISDKENLDINDTGIEICTSSIMDGGDTTDISMTESISFDACSLSEDITSSSIGGSSCSSKEVSPEHMSKTLPSKLEQVKQQQLEWDEIDDLLQVERKIDESEKKYQTMPSPLPSQPCFGQDLESPKILSQSEQSHQQQRKQIVNSEKSENESDNNLILNYNNANNNSNNDNNNINNNNSNKNIVNKLNEEINNNSSSSASSTLKNVDYDDFKKKMDEEYITNTNELKTSNDDTLKSNQPIDPSRINDSLKLYSENIMSKSFSGVEQSLRICPTTIQYQTINTIDPFKIHDTLSLIKNESHPHHRYYHNKNYQLQKSGSESSKSYLSYDNDNDDDINLVDKFGINRSKSGPNWYDQNYFDNENSETLKPSIITTGTNYASNGGDARKPSINIKMDCYGDEIYNWNKNNAQNIDDIRTNDNNNINTKNDNNLNNGAINNDDKTNEELNTNNNNNNEYNEVVLRHKPKVGSTAIKRRNGNKRSRAKLKRRCSINGHFYNRETSFFTPPYGSQMSVWVTSLVTTQEVVNLLLEKYKVDSRPENFALFILRDNGEQRRLKDDDFPLITRVLLGPHEDIVRIFLTDSQNTTEISSEVAQFLNLSIPECRSILDRYTDEMDREVLKIKEKYSEMRRRITQRMESLKVRL